MKNILYSLLVLVLFTSCEEYLELQPHTMITDEQAIVDKYSAQEAVNGMYNALQRHGNYGIYRELLADLASDAVSPARTVFVHLEFQTNDIQSNNSFLNYLWTDPYNAILQTNHVLEKVPLLSDIPDDRLVGMLGEAYFIRALCHFNLLCHFGDIPVITSTQLSDIQDEGRKPVGEVYDFIINDLNMAIERLPDRYEAEGDFTFAKVTRTRATVHAARGLLARVYLHRGRGHSNLQEVITLTTEIINDPFYQLESDYLKAFKGFSSESVFEIYFALDDPNYVSLETNPGFSMNYVASSSLVEALRTDSADTRMPVLAAPIRDQFHTLKYESKQSPVVVIRLADLYLMRAEAYARTEDTLNARADLNLIRSRAGLPAATSMSGDDLFEKIIDERFIELAFEGHRFFDLNRTGKTIEVMSAINPDTWEDSDTLFPLPYIEVNLGLSQNDGY